MDTATTCIMHSCLLVCTLYVVISCSCRLCVHVHLRLRSQDYVACNLYVHVCCKHNLMPVAPLESWRDGVKMLYSHFEFCWLIYSRMTQCHQIKVLCGHSISIPPLGPGLSTGKMYMYMAQATPLPVAFVRVSNRFSITWHAVASLYASPVSPCILDSSILVLYQCILRMLCCCCCEIYLFMS